MTPKELKAASTVELLKVYKEKARCQHSEKVARSVQYELHNRLGLDVLYKINRGKWHMDHGEGDSEFNSEVDNLIKILKG